MEETNLDIDTRIKARAYEIWEESGYADGLHHEHWHQAEQEIKGQQLHAKDPLNGKTPATVREEDPLPASVPSIPASRL